MRDVDRIKPFLEDIEKIWKEKCPDWRFGQLMFNFICESGDPFYWEEEKFLTELKQYFEREVEECSQYESITRAPQSWGYVESLEV